MNFILLSKRQEAILSLVQKKGPITGEEIGDALGLARATLRPDLAFLTRTGIIGAKPRVGYYYDGRGIPDQISSKLNKLIVGDWMGVPKVIDSKLSVYDAIVEMFMRDVGSLFITNADEGLVGIVSRKDLLRANMGQGDIKQMPVSLIMTRMPNLITCQPEDTLLSAAQKLQDHQIDSLPVIGNDPVSGAKTPQPLGRITKTTIVKAFVGLGS
ncbi:MAG: helix-turn-helix transcriptional regulator [Clostridiales bacterium]